MEVCQLCQKLRPLTEKEATTQRPRLVKHQQSLSDLEASSKICSLCHLILSRFDLSRADVLPSWIKDYLMESSVFVMLDRASGRDEPTMLIPRLCFTEPDDWDYIPPLMIERVKDLSELDEGERSICTTDWRYYLKSSLVAVDAGNELCVKRPMWDVNRSQRLEERLSFVRSELNDCLSHHESCGHMSSSSPEDPPQLPTRVIDVLDGPANGDLKVRLIRSNGMKAHYVTLSYCWGGGKTERSTIEELLQGIAPSKLAKTYEDAIYITRAMGIKYLWIDALCIMQNDPAEMEAEMAAMANIYQQAQVTISASASTDFHGGCIQGVDPPLPVIFSADESSALAEQKAYVRCRPRYVEQVLRAPLTSRGWTLQEDLIPLRTLYCANDQMYWQCWLKTVTEDGVIDRTKFTDGRVVDRNENLYDDYGAHWHNQHYATSLKGSTSRFHGNIRWTDFELWLQVINDFTARSLTYPEDRLRAVAGFLGPRDADDTDNLAGLWRDDLAFNLWWRAHPSSRDLNRPAVGLPSWSWISFNGRIEYEDNRLTKGSRERIRPCFDFVDATMKWSGQALTSTLEQATLELDARLQPVSVETREPGHAVHITRDSENDARFRATVSSCTGKSVEFFDRRNGGDDAAEMDRVWDMDNGVIYAMHLSSYCPPQKKASENRSMAPQDDTILLVEPTGRNNNEYRRIGLGRVSRKLELFEGVSNTRITLV